MLKSRSAASLTKPRRRCCLHYNNIFPRSHPSAPVAVHTQASSSLTGTSIRRWNYQDKHQPACLPSPFLVGPTPASAPPPAHLCTFSARLRNPQTAAFITDLGSVTAGIIFIMKSPAFIAGCWFSTRCCAISSHNRSPFLSGESSRSEVFLSGEWNSFPPIMFSETTSHICRRCM